MLQQSLTVLLAWKDDRAASTKPVVLEIIALKRTIAGVLRALGDALSDVRKLLPKARGPCCHRAAGTLLGDATVAEAVLVARPSRPGRAHFVAYLPNAVQVFAEGLRKGLAGFGRLLLVQAFGVNPTERVRVGVAGSLSNSRAVLACSQLASVH